MNILKKILLAGLILVGAVLVLVPFLYWTITFHPPPQQAEPVVCPEQAPTLTSGQRLKILTYNVQFMAGKGYWFWYEGGPDERPSSADIDRTLREVARVIMEERPDLVLLQELDDGSKRTDNEDQLARLLDLLNDEYPCYTTAFYWQADFVPHPNIMGSIGQKIAILSRYKLAEATRYQLPSVEADLVTQGFLPKRAYLEAHLPLEAGTDLKVLTTHLEVASEGAEIKKAEVAQLMDHLSQLESSDQPWLLGGDFNLLPPGQWEQLAPEQQDGFRQDSELRPLVETYAALPTPADATGQDRQDWLTMFLNDPALEAPDRSVDYIFYDRDLALEEVYVRQGDTWEISDHLPVIAVFRVP